MDNLPAWLRYILAIPAGILAVIIMGFFVYLSTWLVSDPNSPNANFMTFIYKNGINVIVFFWAINVIVPKYKFQITLTLSIIFGIIYTILVGMAIFIDSFSLEAMIASIELGVCLILSCYLSFKNKFDLE